MNEAHILCALRHLPSLIHIIESVLYSEFKQIPVFLPVPLFHDTGTVEQFASR